MTRYRNDLGSGSGGSTVGGLTDEVSFTIGLAETLSATDDWSAFLAAEYTDSNAAQAEALRIEPFLTDDNAAQSESRALLARHGATTVTQSAVTGAGWVNVTNTQGLNNSTLATITGSGTTATTAAGTLTGTYASAGSVANETQTGTVSLTFFAAGLTVGTLGSGSLALQYATGGAYTTLLTLTATSAAADRTFTITGVTLATLSSLTFRAVASVTGTTVAPSSAQLDAVVVSFTTAN